MAALVRRATKDALPCRICLCFTQTLARDVCLSASATRRRDKRKEKQEDGGLSVLSHPLFAHNVQGFELAQSPNTIGQSVPVP